MGHDQVRRLNILDGTHLKTNPYFPRLGNISRQATPLLFDSTENPERLHYNLDMLVDCRRKFDAAGKLEPGGDM